MMSEPNAVILPCPMCGREILISNPYEGMPIMCGNCRAQLELCRETGSSSPSPQIAEFITAGGAIASALLTSYVLGQLKREKAREITTAVLASGFVGLITLGIMRALGR